MIDAILAQIYRVALFVRDARLWLLRPQTVGVRVLVTRDGPAGAEVLLVRHRAGKQPWDLPGGAVSRNEPIVEAARREVLEEAGVAVRVERVQSAFDNFRGWRSDTVLVLAATPLGEPRPPRRDLEIAEARFFALGTLPLHLIGPGSRRCIAEWQRGLSGTLGDWWAE